MKILIIILAFAISAQPLQAGFCAMDLEKDQEPAHHMDMSDMSGHASHDCCNPEDTGSPENCDSGMNCGFCFVSASAIPTIPRITPAWESAYTPVFSTGFVLPSHSSPPFRPPIS